MSTERADVVIIGGGCTGTSAAYHLCAAGVKNVLLLEMSYLCSGATGRCGGGMRAQWSTRCNIQLAKYSLDAFGRFSDEIGQDIELHLGGYLLPAFNPQMAGEFRKNIVLQNALGVPSTFVPTEAIRSLAPIIETDTMLGAAYCATDGKSNPFLTVKGYAERARALGARIMTDTTVTGFKMAHGRIESVVTSRGRIDAGWVVNAAGAYAANIAALAGAIVPITPYRHQALVTERVAHCFNPMFINLYESLYFSQTKNGAFVMGQTDKHEIPGFNYRSHWLFELELARKVMKFAPILRHVRVVRHWAGHYAMTPDRQPIIGPCPGVGNMLIASGYSGHGYMLAPASGRIVADLITRGSVDFVDMNEFSMDRFKSKLYVVEADIV